jgi:V-type H+-transporting ATPase subunit H
MIEIPHALQTSRIIAKIACWGKELMGLDDLKFYMEWLKNQLRLTVSDN